MSALAARIAGGELRSRLAALSEARTADDEPGLSEALVAALDDPDPRVRRGALEAIALSSDAGRVRFPDEVAGAVLGLARDAEPMVRAECAVALATVPSVPAFEVETTLLRLLRDDAPEVRQEAAAALGDVRAERGLEPLAKALEDPSASVRFEAAFALASLEDPRGLPLLVASLGGARFTDACEGLKRLGDARAIEPLRGHAARFFLGWPERIVAHGALYTLGAREESARYLLDKAQRSRNRGERELAIATLGHVRAAEALEPLLAIAADAKDKSRAAAITALGHLGDRAALPALERVRAESPALSEDVDDAIARLRAW